MDSLARLRQTGSFIAGILIGLSMVVASFAVTGNDPGEWPILLAFASPVILVAGFALQAFVTSKVRRRIASRPERDVFPNGRATRFVARSADPARRAHNMLTSLRTCVDKVRAA